MTASGSADEAITTCAELRFLPNMIKDCFYELYKSHGGTASRSLFLATFKRDWEVPNKLKIRKLHQHNPCNDCIHFKVARAEAATPAAHALVSKQYKQHLDEMWYDRVVDSRIANLSHDATRKGAVVQPEHNVISLCLDAMDQSKFRVPRGGLKLKAKEVKSWWKPHLHVVGCVLDGVVDMLFVLDATVCKDSNCAATCLSRALERGSRVMHERGLSMPLQLHIRSDNGNAEVKNQTIMKMAAWMVMRGAFTSVALGQFRPGHAHFRADQRFSVVSKLMDNLSDEVTLQDPVDFAETIQAGLDMSAPGVTEVEYVQATHDWKQIFESWELSFHGHVQTAHQTKQHERAVHVFKFIQRKHLDAGVELQSGFSEYAEDPRDCICLTKAYLASAELSQVPFVCVPYAKLADLAPFPTLVAPRNKLPQLAEAEFRKSAVKFGGHFLKSKLIVS